MHCAATHGAASGWYLLGTEPGPVSSVGYLSSTFYGRESQGPERFDDFVPWGEFVEGEEMNGNCIRVKLPRERSFRVTPLRLRVAVRRDFPQKGELSLVMIPRDLDTGELVEEWYPIHATSFILQPHEDAGKLNMTTRMTIIIVLPP